MIVSIIYLAAATNPLVGPPTVVADLVGPGDKKDCDHSYHLWLMATTPNPLMGTRTNVFPEKCLYGQMSPRTCVSAPQLVLVPSHGLCSFVRVLN